jgi:hypothetical protein
MTGVSVSGSTKLRIEASLKVTTNFQWTNKSSSDTSDATSQSAAVIVGGPACGYVGPTDVLVYWDTVYNSFMFEFANSAIGDSNVVCTLIQPDGEGRSPRCWHSATHSSCKPRAGFNPCLPGCHHQGSVILMNQKHEEFSRL